MTDKNVILIGCVGVGKALLDHKTEIALAALEQKHNCKVEVECVLLFDSEKEELRALPTELERMHCREVRENLTMQITASHSELKSAGESLRNYQKKNSQQGWKNKPKHKR